MTSGPTVATGNSTDLENQSLPHIFLTMLSKQFAFSVRELALR
jgi:hypothetical protein